MKEKYDFNHKFEKLGRIDSDDTALILAAKMSKKARNNSIFVITEENIKELTAQIKKLIINDTNQDLIRFQIIHFSESHAIFGEFEIDKRSTPSTLRYLHCDPLPPMTKFTDIITSTFREEISPIANIEIYDSDVTLQKGLGCSYFSIDGAMMLATPPNHTYCPNVIEYIKKYGEEKNNAFEEKNIRYIQSASLPPRLIRGLQYIDDGTGNANYIRGLNSLIFNAAEKNTIINKDGDTAESAIRKDLKTGPSKINPNEMRTFNIRAERKMQNYGDSVRDFIQDKNINDPEFSSIIEQYKINGLIQFCEDKMENTIDPKMQPK
ncbi:MAG: hypothetical protein H0U73_02565 [Tatlockia sp.]|nr:hypothetical protein [Tatlockia sp.]